MARRIAKKLSQRFKRVLAEDLEAGAMEGLWQSALKYYALDPARFEAVAYLRIRGACIDVIRADDWLSRHSRRTGAGDHIRLISAESMPDQGASFLGLSVEHDPTDGIDEARRSAALQAAIARMPPRRRDIVRAVLAGQKQRDIGARLGSGSLKCA